MIINNQSPLQSDEHSACHLYIPGGGGGSGARLGAWLMLPAHSSGRVEQLASTDTVVLYLHGNGSNRSHTHRSVHKVHNMIVSPRSIIHVRVGMYKLLLSLGYYVLAVDYRGYGDSTNITPSEETTVSHHNH